MDIYVTCMIVVMQNEGVRIFILVYKEMEIAVGINSFYTKTTLTKLHSNIKVGFHQRKHGMIDVSLYDVSAVLCSSESKRSM